MAIQDPVHWQKIFARLTALEAETRQLRLLLMALRPTATAASLEERQRRAIAAAGRFRSGLSNLAAEHDRYLIDAYQA